MDMRNTAAEKLEIFLLVDGSELGLNRTLNQLGIHKSTFYNWYRIISRGDLKLS